MTHSSSLFAASALLFAACVAPAALAADSPEETCAKLRAALQTQVELMEGVRSPEDAAKAVSPLRKCQKAQDELFGAEDAALWEYISNTDGAKQPLVELLQRMAAQLSRLEDVNYYDNAELKELLYTQVVTES
ncbi:MAG: hypothetical protein MJ051_04700 [Akkermansia sp.]|nr:hypothetical protein [Akkermansia sp.]